MAVVNITDDVFRRLYIDKDILVITHTRQWRRMKSIMQLGFVNDVFHTAGHNRGEHMVGAAHLARSAGMHLQALYPDKVSTTQVRIVTIAALLHDIGHGPFSHEFEDACHALRLVFDHELMTIKLILMMRKEYPKVDRLLSDDEWRQVDACITGNMDGPAVRWMVQLVSGKVDVDKLDYICRDFKNIGITSSMDASTALYIIDHMVLVDDGVNLGFDVSAVNAIGDMYLARQKLHEYTCMQHTVLGLKMMLRRCIVDSEELSALVTRSVADPEEFIKLVDTFLLTYLNTTTERGYGYVLSSMLQFDRMVPQCLGIVSSATEKHPPAYLLAVLGPYITVMSVCIGFGKTKRNVLLDIDFVNRDGERVVVEDLLAQTIMPSDCTVYKHYCMVDPLITLTCEAMTSIQANMKDLCASNPKLVWTRRPLSVEVRGRSTLE